MAVGETAVCPVAPIRLVVTVVSLPEPVSIPIELAPTDEGATLTVSLPGALPIAYAVDPSSRFLAMVRKLVAGEGRPALRAVR